MNSSRQGTRNPSSSAEPPILAAGPRVIIRAPQAGDADALLALNQSSLAHYHPWVAPPATHEQFAAYLERLQHENMVGCLIIQRETAALLGVINLSQIFYGNFCSAYLGYYLGAPYVRQGYMAEALRLVITYAFTRLALHRLEANIQPENHGSLALVRSLGFTREGFSRRYLKIAGAWRDHERWAILADEWKL